MIRLPPLPPSRPRWPLWLVVGAGAIAASTWTPSARAEGEPSPAAADSAVPNVEGASPPSSGGEATIAAEVKTRPSKRPPCGCAKARLLRHGKSAQLGAGRSVAAWVDDGDDAARLETFAADYFERRATSEADKAIPVAIDTFEEPSAVPSKHRLVRVRSAGSYPAPFWLGMMRSKESLPKDLLQVEMAGEPGEVSPLPPVVEQLWLGRHESLERAGCGVAETWRLAWREQPATPEVVGFIVRFVPDGGGPGSSAVIDERHARSFGLGYIERCEHGLPVPEGQAGTFEIRPVSGTFGVGDAWRFRVDLEEPVPAATLRPASAGEDEEPNPLLEGIPGFAGEPLGNREDVAALGAMLGVVAAAASTAAILWPVLRRRRRRLEVIKCPVCKTEHELDLADPKTDGMFCPSCGGSSVYVSLSADGVPRATVLKLDGRSVPPSAGEAPPAGAEPPRDATSDLSPGEASGAATPEDDGSQTG